MTHRYTRIVAVAAVTVAAALGLHAQGGAPQGGVAQTHTPAARGRAPSLARPTPAAKAPNADGFLQRWLLLEPIRVNGQLTDSAVRAAVAASDRAVSASNLANRSTALPADGGTVTVGDATLAWHAVDTSLYNVNLYHFAYALNRPTSNVLFWATTIVNAPREMSGVRLAIGSNAASIWWVNGQEVIGIFNERQAVIDDGVSKRLTLKKGPNVVSAAIVNAGGATDFCARFLDEAGQPVKGITISLTDR